MLHTVEKYLDETNKGFIALEEGQCGVITLAREYLT